MTNISKCPKCGAQVGNRVKFVNGNVHILCSYCDFDATAYLVRKAKGTAEKNRVARLNARPWFIKVLDAIAV